MSERITSTKYLVDDFFGRWVSHGYKMKNVSRSRSPSCDFCRHSWAHGAFYVKMASVQPHTHPHSTPHCTSPLHCQSARGGNADTGENISSWCSVGAETQTQKIFKKYWLRGKKSDDLSTGDGAKDGETVDHDARYSETQSKLLS